MDFLNCRNLRRKISHSLRVPNIELLQKRQYVFLMYISCLYLIPLANKIFRAQKVILWRGRQDHRFLSSISISLVWFGRHFQTTNQIPQWIDAGISFAHYIEPLSLDWREETRIQFPFCTEAVPLWTFFLFCISHWSKTLLWPYKKEQCRERFQVLGRVKYFSGGTIHISSNRTLGDHICNAVIHTWQMKLSQANPDLCATAHFP